MVIHLLTLVQKKKQTFFNLNFVGKGAMSYQLFWSLDLLNQEAGDADSCSESNYICSDLELCILPKLLFLQVAVKNKLKCNGL